MQNMRHSTSPKHHTGFTLVELMIAIALSTVLIAGVMSVFTGSVRSNTETMLNAKMTQELRAAMEIITSDIRRAGYWTNAGTTAATGNSNPFGVELVRPDDGSGNACVLYSYDTADGRRGFRLNNGVIEWLRGNNNNSCDNGNWDPLTETTSIVINKLDFIDTSTCWNVSKNQSCDPCSSDNWSNTDVLTYTRKIEVQIKANMALDASRVMDMKEIIQVRNAESGEVTVAGPNNSTTYCRKKLPLKTV